jgi:hypothetical protein
MAFITRMFVVRNISRATPMIKVLRADATCSSPTLKSTYTINLHFPVIIESMTFNSKRMGRGLEGRLSLSLIMGKQDFENKWWNKDAILP